MNDGQISKIFLGCGLLAERNLAHLQSSWPYGYFNSGVLNDWRSHSIEWDRKIEEQPIIGIVIDIEELVLSNALNIIKEFPQSESIDLVVFIESETKLITNIEEELILAIQDTLKCNMVQRFKSDSKNISLLLDLYANLLCGHSPFCIDHVDIVSSFNEGDVYKASQMTMESFNDMNKSIYQMVNSLSLSPQEINQTVAAVLTITGDIKQWDVDICESYFTTFRSLFPSEAAIIPNHNLQDHDHKPIASIIVCLVDKPSRNSCD